MRKLGFLFLLLSFSVLGQTTLMPDVATDFVHVKINELNLKIWNAVHLGKIKAYRNDSLATEVSSSTIKERSAQIVSVKELKPEKGGIVEEVVIEPFDSINGYEGARLSYEYIISEFGVEFILRSIAPMHLPITELGIDLGSNPLFWVKRRSLDTVLSKEESKFYNALLKQRMMLGDFMNPYIYPQKRTKEFGRSITDKTVFEDHFWNNFTSKEDTAIGSHLFLLLQFAALNYQQEKGVDIFYRDLGLKMLYKFVPHDLSETITIDVPNPDNPEDPYDIIGRDYTVNFQFDDISEVKVHSLNADYTIEMVNTAAKNERTIFVKYSSLAQYLIANDRIVLEALLAEITH